MNICLQLLLGVVLYLLFGEIWGNSNGHPISYMAKRPWWVWLMWVADAVLGLVLSLLVKGTT